MTEPTLSITTLRRFDACDLYKRVDDITRVMGRVLHEDEEIPLRIWWDLDTTSVADLWWSLRCLGEPGRRIGAEAACLAARRVLPLTRVQDRAVCLAAIEAAEGWLRGDVTQKECREAARAAAADARAAAAAAYAAAAAADARAAAADARDAYAAAYAAAADARAAAAAAYAAAAAADATFAAAADARDAYAAAYAAAAAADATFAAAAERSQQRIDLYRIAFGD